MKPIDLEPLSVMELRAKPGEFLDAVVEEGRSFIIERKGHRIALLVPVATLIPDVDPTRLAAEMQELDRQKVEVRRTRFTREREIQLSFELKVASETFTVEIELPHKYPSVAPRVRLLARGERRPHQRDDGTLCLYGEAQSWNPGRDGILRTLELTRAWVEKHGIDDRDRPMGKEA